MWKRLRNAVDGNVRFIQLLLSLGIASAAATLVIKVTTLWGWLSVPYAVPFGLSVFLVLLALALAYLPYVFHPTGPFGALFGTSFLLIGADDEKNRRVFARSPALRRECFATARKLREFTDRETKKMPADPPRDLPEDAPERIAYQQARQAFDQRFDTLYRSMWKYKVDALFLEARGAFFGPSPLPRLYARVIPFHGVQDLAESLDRLAVAMPDPYTDQIHEARVERLRKLRQEGLGFEADVGQLLTSRTQAAMALSKELRELALPEVAGPTPHVEGWSTERQQWERERHFNEETATIFSTTYGGTLRRLIAELDAFGQVDENLQRLSAFGPFGLRVSSFDLEGIGSHIAALCQRIPYD